MGNNWLSALTFLTILLIFLIYGKLVNLTSDIIICLCYNRM